MSISPLRYPGGKAKLFPFFVELIRCNNLFGYHYCEPYAGGAGLALKLLTSGFVDRISLNDIDPAIFAFWLSVLRQPDEFCRLIDITPITMKEWFRQRACWAEAKTRDPLALGFAAYFLNRTSRSGIIEGAGPIGGYAQSGSWNIAVRLIKDKQISNILSLSNFSRQIEISNQDALLYLRRYLSDGQRFFYLDPPYYMKGAKLYKNFYRPDDHISIAEVLKTDRLAKWVVSYDDVPQIREIYKEFKMIGYSLRYSAGRKTSGREIIYLGDRLAMPDYCPFQAAA